MSASPFLLGDAPMLCDFALLGQLTYLGRPPGSQALLARHAAVADYLARMKAFRAAAREPWQAQLEPAVPAGSRPAPSRPPASGTAIAS